MSTDIEKARAVAADLLRQAGDETGARVLERVPECLELVRWRAEMKGQQRAFDLCAYLDPEWAKAEVERAHGEALKMHGQRSDWPDTPEERDPRGEWDPDGSQE